MGRDSHDQMPLIVMASVVAFVVAQLVRRTDREADGAPATGGAR